MAISRICDGFILAGLRSVEDEIVKAAKIDGAGLFTVYWKILIPMMRPVFFTSFVILVHISIKSYDLIVALTQGGPGISTTMPALYMTQTAFHKAMLVYLQKRDDDVHGSCRSYYSLSLF